MFGLNFNVFKSNTVIGFLVAVLGYLSRPDVLAVLPVKVAAVVTGVGIVWGVIGGRNAIANNGPSVTPDESAKANGVG